MTVELNDDYFGRNPDPIVTDETGYYNFVNIDPSKYTITAIENGFELHQNTIQIGPDYHSYNISKPKLADVQGKAFIDLDSSGDYDPGEETPGVTVELLYTRDDTMLVGSMVTDSQGDYAFTSLIPGTYYSLNATLENSTTGYADYQVEEPIELEANTTLTFNISLVLAQIEVSGMTRHDGASVGDITVMFSPDGSRENNTAQSASTISDADTGEYTALLTPGYYNVSVDQYDDSGKFTFSGSLAISRGAGKTTYDITLEKHSVTVRGGTTHAGAAVGNITILFAPDDAVANNTAEAQQAKSDATGSYTVELVPGSYTISVDNPVNESGQQVKYTYTGTLVIHEDDTLVTKDIALLREILTA